jgi:hypothetical protein
MKHIPLFPRPVSWLSAGLLYVFLWLWTAFVAMVAPRLYELFHTSPRMAALGFLGVWTSPIAFVALGHQLIHAFLDRADGSGTKPARGIVPDLASLWAGVYAWLVIMFASSVVLLAMLVLFPPPPSDQLMTMFAWPFDARARAGLHTFTWVLVAAQLYDLERAVKERAKRGEV